MINAQDKNGYEAVILLENAQTQLQQVLSKSVTDFITRQQIGLEANNIINKCLARLKDLKATESFITNAETGLKATFVKWYSQTLANLLKQAKISRNPIYLASYKEIAGVLPKDKETNALIVSLGNVEGYERGSIGNIRDFFTTGEKGYSQALIEDYQKRVNQQIHNLASKNLVMLDKNGRKLSIRNLAEMEVRYQELTKDAERLKAKGVKFAYATSHSNASERCQIWQGKLFIIDVEIGSIRPGKFIKDYKPKSVGKIDGIEYYSLLDAVNHGFLGYNCRHRLIAYQKGMTKPREYPANYINKERKREQTLRNMENNIRKAKRNYMLATSKEERSAYRKLSKDLQGKYVAYCDKVGYPIAEWRTRVSLDERNELPNIEYDPSKGTTYGESISAPKPLPKAEPIAKVVEEPMKEEVLTVDVDKIKKTYTGNDKLIETAFNNAKVDKHSAMLLNNIDKLRPVTIGKGSPRFVAGFNTLKVLSNKDTIAFYHEFGHSVDNNIAYFSKYETEGEKYTWCSEGINPIREQIVKEWNGTIPEELLAPIKEQEALRIKTIKDNYIKTGKYNADIIKEVKKQYGSKFYSQPDWLQKSILEDVGSKLFKKELNAYVSKNENYNAWTYVSDMLDNITSGRAINSNELRGSHGFAYYFDTGLIQNTGSGNVKKENTELFANYTALRLGNKTEQLEFLKKKIPSLMEALETTFNKAAETIGGKK